MSDCPGAIRRSFFQQIKTLPVADLSQDSSLVVRLRRDDGGVVYLKGAGVFRSNKLMGICF